MFKHAISVGFKEICDSQKLTATTKTQS